MIARILREQRRRKWKSTAKWRKAQAKKARLEKMLEKLTESLKPDYEHNENGILISVYKLRNRQGQRDVRFEFSRKDRFGPASDFGVGDFKALISAIESARLYGNDAT
jgi:hypothetical protein